MNRTTAFRHGIVKLLCYLIFSCILPFLGRNGDALINCYENRSEVASARYYRYKRNGNFTEAEPETQAAETEVVELVAPVPEAEEKKAEEKKEE